MKIEIKEEIVKINKELGGTLVRPNSLDFACDIAKDEKNIYKRLALIIRAIAVDHTFSDFSKSTAMVFTIREFAKEKIKCNDEELINLILRIAKNNINNLNKIEKSLRKWFPKKN